MVWFEQYISMHNINDFILSALTQDTLSVITQMSFYYKQLIVGVSSWTFVEVQNMFAESLWFNLLQSCSLVIPEKR